jgi:peptidoglycan/LPS O-acetylase OafA/YrhL
MKLSDQPSGSARTPSHCILEYRPAIDGLRCVAILSVFLFHLNREWLPGGFLGVDVFFVISGYLITSIIQKQCQAGSFSLTRFYQRRIARIFPAFFTVALMTVACARFIYSARDLALTGTSLWFSALSAANFRLLLQGHYFEVSPDAQPFLHYWSLAVEEQFYLIFPLLVIVVLKYARRHLLLVLGGVFYSSLMVSIVLAIVKPAWAFYLLPSRAWELLAGCLLAFLNDQGTRLAKNEWRPAVSAMGLAAIGLSFLVVNESWRVPGYIALVPVLGAVGVLIPPGETSGLAEKLLRMPCFVLIGRISYSLYLWHWPIFSMIDYKLVFASDELRIALKIALSFLAAGLSFWLLENPARLYLARPKQTALAYSFVACATCLSVALGFQIQCANYVVAADQDVAKGGIVFTSRTATKSIMLMGDSLAAMYGRMLKGVCAELDCRLNVICADDRDPLPSLNGAQGRFCLDSLAAVRKEHPDYLVLACSWDLKLTANKERLALAVAALKDHVGHLFILNQPPILPASSERPSLRQGAHPPFYEEWTTRRKRLETNKYLMSLTSTNVSVIDIASHFEAPKGAVLFADASGRRLYQDRKHLSGCGADSVRSLFMTSFTSLTSVNKRLPISGSHQARSGTSTHLVDFDWELARVELVAIQDPVQAVKSSVVIQAFDQRTASPE